MSREHPQVSLVGKEARMSTKLDVRVPMTETPADTTMLKKTARLAGLAYLGLAIFGLLGNVVIRSRLYVSGDAVATAAKLAGHETLARFGIAADLLTVVTQSLAALYFFKLFRKVDAFAAGSIAACGFMNSVAILASTVFTATALKMVVAGTVGDPTTPFMLYNLSDAAWGTGALFFGLWLIPMGWLAWRSGYMPRPLGWILMGGGVCYLLSAFVRYLARDASFATDALLAPASVGEFWMIGYLLVKGVGHPSQVEQGGHR
jgi:Domain of unknown function (DUF4386)